MMKGKSISAQEVVKKFNIRYATLNYYTAIGLLPTVGKIGNRRFYDEEQTRERLNKIAELNKEGYPLGLIRRKLSGV